MTESATASPSQYNLTQLAPLDRARYLLTHCNTPTHPLRLYQAVVFARFQKLMRETSFPLDDLSTGALETYWTLRRINTLEGLCNRVLALAEAHQAMVRVDFRYLASNGIRMMNTNLPGGQECCFLKDHVSILLEKAFEETECPEWSFDGKLDLSGLVNLNVATRRSIYTHTNVDFASLDTPEKVKLWNVHADNK